jgi:hypothetical protein
MKKSQIKNWDARVAATEIKPENERILKENQCKISQ